MGRVPGPIGAGHVALPPGAGARGVPLRCRSWQGCRPSAFRTGGLVARRQPAPLRRARPGPSPERWVARPLPTRSATMIRSHSLGAILLLAFIFVVTGPAAVHAQDGPDPSPAPVSVAPDGNPSADPAGGPGGFLPDPRQWAADVFNQV